MADDKILDRIRALLAKAEGTDYPEEAETYSAKAAELMARHNVEQAMLAGRDVKADPVEAKSIILEDPHAKVKALLLHNVAAPLSCTILYMPGGSGRKDKAMLYGHRSDIERVEMLYTSLLLQAVRAVSQVRPDAQRYFNWREGTYEWRKPAAATVASYRRSWLNGFARRVGERLKDATTQAVQEHGRPGTDVVLRNRLQDAKALMREQYPRTRTANFSANRMDGYSAGQAAGSRADIGQRRFAGSRSAIAG
jgi:hypothetical protein